MANIGERTSTQRLIEDLYGHIYGEQIDLREVLRRKYVDESKSMKEIAEELHVGTGTIHKWIHEYGIQPKRMIWV